MNSHTPGSDESSRPVEAPAGVIGVLRDFRIKELGKSG